MIMVFEMSHDPLRLEEGALTEALHFTVDTSTSFHLVLKEGQEVRETQWIQKRKR